MTRFYVFTYKRKDYLFKDRKDMIKFAKSNGVRNKINYKLVYTVSEELI